MSFNSPVMRRYEPEFEHLHPQVRGVAQHIYDTDTSLQNYPRAEQLTIIASRARKYCERVYKREFPPLTEKEKS